MHAAVLNCLAASGAALLLAWPMSAAAAPWRTYVVAPAGDEVMVRTKGRALRPSGSRGEVDLPVRVRFSAPLASPVGPVAMADVTVRVLCTSRSMTANRVAVRTADGKAFAIRDRQAAVKAVRSSVDQTLSAPVFIDKVCQRPSA